MKKNIYKYLAGNDYPGRGIVLGKSPDGQKAFVAYWIMGRSANKMCIRDRERSLRYCCASVVMITASYSS